MSTKASILDHPTVAAWLNKLPLADAQEVEGQHALGRPTLSDGFRPYFYFVLARLDITPSPWPTYSARAGGQTWLAALLNCFEQVQSDVVIQLALDQAGTSKDLRLLADAPGISEPWSLLSVADLEALVVEQPDCTLHSLAHELCLMQADRLRTLAPNHLPLKKSLAAKRLELHRHYY